MAGHGCDDCREGGGAEHGRRNPVLLVTPLTAGVLMMERSGRSVDSAAGSEITIS